MSKHFIGGKKNKSGHKVTFVHVKISQQKFCSQITSHIITDILYTLLDRYS